MAADAMWRCLQSAEQSGPVLRQWKLRDLERGHRNMCHLAETLGRDTLHNLAPALARILPRCADPDMALNNLERFLANPTSRDRQPTLLEPRSRTLETLLQLF